METTTALLQSALTPAFLLVALGSILNLFTGRLSRIVDRSRSLQDQYTATQGYDHELVVSELRDQEKRIRTVNTAIGLAVISAIIVCILIGILFFMGMAGVDLSSYAASAFLVAIALMAASLVMFLIEVRYAISIVRIREEYLERPEPKKRRRSKPLT
jgi:amino acid transporter